MRKMDCIDSVYLEKYIHGKRGDMKACAQYCDTYFPETKARVIETADLTCQQKFMFNMDWDLEQTHESVDFEGEIDWSTMPGDDAEWVFALNRHRYWIFLGQAYQFTGDVKYVEAFKKQVTSWIQSEPLIDEKKPTTWRSIEAGLRLDYWLQAYGYFVEDERIDTAFKNMFFESVRLHCDYLMGVHSYHSVISNWGVIESSGLYLGGVALGCMEYMEAAMARLEECMSAQLFNDGVHWEQSPMYHNEVLTCFLSVLEKSKYETVKFSKKTEACIYQMAMVNVLWRKPDGHEFCQGDSDLFDLRDVISRSAVIFEDSILRGAGHERLDYISAWELGCEGIACYEQLEAEDLEEVSTVLADSGNYYMRSSWEENGHLLHFTNGSLGGGHGNCEKLHIDLVANGEDVLIDGGRNTYVDKPIRHYLKSCHAHNLVLVNDTPFMEIDGAWGYKKLAESIQRPYRLNKEVEYVEGAHLGDITQGAFVNRKIIYIRPDIFVVSDEVVSQEEKTITQLLHFSPKGEVNVEEQCIRYLSQKNKVQFKFLGNGKIDLETREHSSYYNELDQHRMAKITGTSRPRMASTFVIDINQDGSTEAVIESVPVQSVGKYITFDPEQLECVRIEKHGVIYLVFFAHGETHGSLNMFEACGVQFVGRVTVVKIDGEQVETTMICR